MKSASAIILACCLAAPVATLRAEDQNPPSATSNFSTQLSTQVSGFVSRAHDLVLGAMGFMGIPYLWGGSTPEAGFDCSGFVQYVVRQAAGLVLPRSSFDQIRQGTSVDRNDLQAGDLVFFNTMRATASHVGIYIGENRFIHAPSRGKTVEIADFTNSYWQTRYDGARRLPL
jgi:cell wall-associated NlpC family hydrolase